MNLQKLNVQEMQTEELMETSGGDDGLLSLWWDIMTDPDSHRWIGTSARLALRTFGAFN